MSGTSTRPAARLDWLDFYRGAAVLVMIEAHVCNTFLAPALRATAWFGRFTYLNGLVAPSFLFIAGFALGLGRARRVESPTGYGRRLRHLAGVAAIGYALHFPWADLLAHRWEAALSVGTQVDILPCLAASLAAMLLLEILLPRYSDVAAAVLGLAVLIATPALALWTLAPVPVLAFLNQTTGSLFPLFPWAAFALAGYLAGTSLPAAGRFLWPGPCALAVAFTMGGAHWAPSGAAFFFERLAWILALVPLAMWLAPRLALNVVLFAGRQSLALYVAHLLLISALVGCGLGTQNAGTTGWLLLVVLAFSLTASFATSWLLQRWKMPRRAPIAAAAR